MLVKYDPDKGSSKYNRFYDEKMKDMIYPGNPEYLEVIRDLLLDYIKMGNFDCEVVMDDIRVINCKISEEVIQAGIDEGVVIGYWNNDDDFLQFLVEASDDLLDTIFLGQDIMIAIQEMIYESARKYSIPLSMKKGMFFEFPEILEMYCRKGHIINSLPDNMEVYIHSNHAQMVMFDELMDNEPSFYGRGNVLIYDENEIKDKVNFLEGR